MVTQPTPFETKDRFAGVGSVTVTPVATTVRLPHAQILGVEQNNVELLAYENGFWNPISGADVQAEWITLAKLARERAAARNLPAQAEESFRTQLKGRIGNAPPLQMIFYQSAKSE